MSQTVQTITSGNMKDLGSAVIQSIPTDLPDEDAIYWIGKKRELHRKIQQILRRSNDLADTIMTPTASTLLELVTTVQLPAIEAFSANDNFRIGTTDGVRITYLGDNFRANFLKGSGKNEIYIAAAELRIHKLRKNSLDAPIIAELGGEEGVETTLAQMWQMMKAQGQGQKGNLLINGYANIFYIKDDTGTLWAVCASWDDVGWVVSASSVTYPDGWSRGYRVVSR